MTIKRKLSFSFGLFIVLIAGTIVLNQIVSQKAEDRYEIIRTQIQPAIKSIDKYKQINSSLNVLLKKKLESKNDHSTTNNKILSILEVEIPNLIRSLKKIIKETSSKKIKEYSSGVLLSTKSITEHTYKILNLLESKKDYIKPKKLSESKDIFAGEITIHSNKVNRNLYRLKQLLNESNFQSQNELKKSFSQISLIIFIFGTVGIIIGLIIAIKTINSIITPINKLKDSASIVGSGDYNHKLQLHAKDELSELGKSFNVMTGSLKNSFNIIQAQKELQERINFTETSKNKLYESLKGELSVEQISKRVLDFFLNYYKAPMGAFHIITENNTLVCEALFAFDKDKKNVIETPVGRGIIGEAALHKKPILIDDVPDEYSKIKTTLGELKAKCIFIVPILHGNESVGVLELACLTKPKDSEIEFMNQVNNSIGIAINAAQGLRYLEEAHAKLEQSSETLQLKNKELEQFVYITSHDLQEPLRTISSYADILEEDFKDAVGDEGMQYIGFLQKASKRLTTQIHSLLELSKLGSETKRGVIDFNTIFTNLHYELSFLIKEKNGQLIFPPFVSEKIQGSPIELQLLFQNLIVNAFKYNNNDNPTTEVSYMDNGDHLTFCVSDNGIGIKQRHFEKIFQIFQRLENGEGSGIGLAHCKKIVESHQGKIWVDSEPGKGSHFFFNLPKKQ